MNVKLIGVGFAVVVAVALAGSEALARDRPSADDQPVELRAIGEPKEVPVNREVTGCRIEVVNGSVIINTVVVREGGKKTPITVGRRLGVGESVDLPFGPKRLVTGLRISDGGGGTYRVFINAEPPPGAQPPSQSMEQPSQPSSRSSSGSSSSGSSSRSKPSR